jgi:polysaccharide biosynthesis transport protein
VIETMRSAISIEPVTAEIQAAGAGGKSTIAFALSYFYSDPIKTQAVSQALTEQVLQIDAAKSAETAANTVQFLTDQSSGLELQIQQLETAISEIKARNGLVLSSGSLTMLGGSGGSADAQIAMLQQANSQLNAQRDMSKTSADRDPIVAQAEAALAAAQATYSDSHPDVVIARQRLAEARNLAKSTASRLPVNTIDSQIAANNRQIALLQAARSQESARISGALNAQARAPAVMEQIAQLQSKLDGVNAQYQSVSGRLLAARAGKKAEDEQQAERLSVIDPPVIPEEPTWPNRPLFIAGGLAAGIALGIMLAGLLELIYRPIRDVRAVEMATGEAPLVVIPTIGTSDGAPKGLLARLGLGGIGFGRNKGGKDDDDDDED